MGSEDGLGRWARKMSSVDLSDRRNVFVEIV